MIMKDIAATENLKRAILAFMESIGEDMTRDGLNETPDRFIKQLNECLIGYRDSAKNHVKVFDNDGYRDLVVVRDISFCSLCEHHMLPFFGTVDVAYLPKNKILGLSKFARIVDALSKRLQVQERITKQIADLLEERLEPALLIVKISAKHMCMGMRGVRRPNSVTDTMIIRGDTSKYESYIRQFQDGR